mmetsp:Transcript_22579/g.85568  ORF Transcript_22579/g.85568 Transcript_22579/m.85568 type:complete len:263 (-) Transcript_22579:5154-5942(-)
MVEQTPHSGVPRLLAGAGQNRRRDAQQPSNGAHGSRDVPKRSFDGTRALRRQAPAWRLVVRPAGRQRHRFDGARSQTRWRRACPHRRRAKRRQRFRGAQARGLGRCGHAAGVVGPANRAGGRDAALRFACRRIRGGQGRARALLRGCHEVRGGRRWPEREGHWHRAPFQAPVRRGPGRPRELHDQSGGVHWPDGHHKRTRGSGRGGDAFLHCVRSGRRNCDVLSRDPRGRAWQRLVQRSVPGAEAGFRRSGGGRPRQLGAGR